MLKNYFIINCTLGNLYVKKFLYLYPSYTSIIFKLSGKFKKS